MTNTEKMPKDKGRLIVVALCVVLFVSIIYVAVVFADYLRIDSCLDSGGRWNANLGVCEMPASR